MLAFLINVSHVGYPVLFALVMAESSGLPVPGETALIGGAILASQGDLQIELVIALAATAAIVGDNIGYLIGRKGGRWLLERPGAFQEKRLQALVDGEIFFQKQAPRPCFLGRFVLGLRVWASWLAGATHMRWRSFAFWNAAGDLLGDRHWPARLHDRPCGGKCGSDLRLVRARCCTRLWAVSSWHTAAMHEPLALRGDIGCRANLRWARSALSENAVSCSLSDSTVAVGPQPSGTRSDALPQLRERAQLAARETRKEILPHHREVSASCSA